MLGGFWAIGPLPSVEWEQILASSKGVCNSDSVSLKACPVTSVLQESEQLNLCRESAEKRMQTEEEQVLKASSKPKVPRMLPLFTDLPLSSVVEII